VTATRNRVLEVIAAKQLSASAPNRAYAAILGCSERTIARHLADLAAAGHIIIHRRSPNLAGPGTDPTGRSITVTEDGLSSLNSTPNNTTQTPDE
jgi:hypothetical protein